MAGRMDVSSVYVYCICMYACMHGWVEGGMALFSVYGRM